MAENFALKDMFNRETIGDLVSALKLNPQVNGRAFGKVELVLMPGDKSPGQQLHLIGLYIHFRKSPLEGALCLDRIFMSGHSCWIPIHGFR